MSAVVSFPLDFQLKLILSVIKFYLLSFSFMRAVNYNFFPLNTR